MVGAPASIMAFGLFQRLRNPLECGDDVFAGIESADANMAFATFAETRAGRAHDLGFVEQ